MVRPSQISNSSKLSCMLSLPASMKRIRIKNSREKVETSFSHYKPMGIFSDLKGQLTPQCGPIRLKFELVSALMHVIVTCNYKKERMKNSQEKVGHSFCHSYPICYHGNQCSDLAEFQTHPSSHVCYHYLQV